MSLSILKFLPCILGGLVALYWATKITIHGTFEFISTKALRSMWIGLGIATLWLVYLEYPLSRQFTSEPSLLRTWLAVLLGVIFLFYGIFASRKGLILFTADTTTPIYEKPTENQYEKDVLENEPDRSKELKY